MIQKESKLQSCLNKRLWTIELAIIYRSSTISFFNNCCSPLCALLCTMTDTQERVVRDEIAPGQKFGFLRRKLNNFIASESFICAPWVVVVAVAGLFYHHHTIKPLEARVENLEAEFGMLQRTLVPTNCAEVYKYGKTTSGVYMINPDNAGPSFAVFCDQKTAGGGWTVFQKRLDGSVDFDRSWSDYKNGFGNLSGEFWLGLDKISRLKNSSIKLRVDLEDFDGRTDYAEYDIFAVANERTKYKLSVGKYSDRLSEAIKRTSGDSLTQHDGYSFTTKDKDNDKDGDNCAQRYKGGWWYHSCYHSNLNGVYRHAKDSANAHGVSWNSWKRNYNSLKRAEMKIRPVEF